MPRWKVALDIHADPLEAAPSNRRRAWEHDRQKSRQAKTTRRQTMKQLSTVVFILAIFLISSPLPVGAQTAPGAAKAAQTSGYQISEEVTLTGTVSSVLAKSAPGMMVGSHLLLETRSGPVDASLGRFGLMGNGAPSVAVGQQIEVTRQHEDDQGQAGLLGSHFEGRWRGLCGSEQARLSRVASGA